MTVSKRAKVVPRTRLKKPTSLKSPTARSSNTKASVKESQLRTPGVRGMGRMRAVAAIRAAHANSASATANVARAEGVNAGRPLTSGTTASNVMRPPKAQYAWRTARATKTVAIAIARRLLIMRDVVFRGRAADDA